MKYSSESVEKSFVVVVSDAAAILDFTEHVTHRVPRHALRTHSACPVRRLLIQDHTPKQLIHQC